MEFKNTKSLKSDIIFIGIDQSLTNTGLTIIKNNQEIIFSKSFGTKPILSFEERLLSIKSFLFNIIKNYNPEYTAIALEGLAFNRNKTNNSAILFGLFSVILTTMCEMGYRYSIIPPTSLKKFVTGNGRSDKLELIDMIPDNDKRILLNLSGIKDTNAKKFEDISDSYWLAKVKLNEHLFN